MATLVQTSPQPHALLQRVKSAGKRFSIASQKAKLTADMIVIDQKIKATKYQFGVDLYDVLAEQADTDPMFLLTEGGALEEIRGLFVTCYKDQKALLQKISQANLQLESVKEQRKVVNSRHGNTLSFEVPANTVGERILNAPKNMQLTKQENNAKTTLSLLEEEFLQNKRMFGVKCYDFLLELEKCDCWIPHDAQVRLHYNHARREIAQLELIREEKEEDRDELDAQK